MPDDQVTGRIHLDWETGNARFLGRFLLDVVRHVAVGGMSSGNGHHRYDDDGEE